MQLLLVAKGDDLKAATKLMKGYKAAALASKGKLVFVTVNAVSFQSVPSFFGSGAVHMHVASYTSTTDTSMPLLTAVVP